MSHIDTRPHDWLQPWERVVTLREVRDDIELLMVGTIDDDMRTKIARRADAKIAQVQRSIRTERVDAKLDEFYQRVEASS